MAEKIHHGYAGLRPGTIDHRSPPVPASAPPEVKKKPDHFARVRPGTIDHSPKPATPPADKK